MRNGQLFDILRAYAEEAATLLAAEAAAGAEVPFEIAAEPSRNGVSLYCYRPLTGQFVADREELLSRLPSAPAAQGALARMARVLRADAVLRDLVTAVIGEATDFGFSAERFAIAYAELEGRIYAGSARSTIFAPVLGLEIESDEVALADGLSLVRAESLDGAPDGADGVLVVLERQEKPGEQPAFSLARSSFRALITALRLFDSVAPSLAPVAWARVDDGPWRLAPSGGLGRPRGVLTIVEPQEDELRAFVSLIGRRMPRSGELAWALSRYEMGCGQPTPGQGLSDHLLALRSLLEPEGSASGRLAPRLAALCAEPLERPALAARAADAIALERSLIAGLAPPVADPDALAREIGGHLRALLRDALCGHLPPDLRSLAEELLAEDAEPVAAV